MERERIEQLQNHERAARVQEIHLEDDFVERRAEDQAADLISSVRNQIAGIPEITVADNQAEAVDWPGLTSMQMVNDASNIVDEKLARRYINNVILGLDLGIHVATGTVQHNFLDSRFHGNDKKIMAITRKKGIFYESDLYFTANIKKKGGD